MKGLESGDWGLGTGDWGRTCRWWNDGKSRPQHPTTPSSFFVCQPVQNDHSHKSYNRQPQSDEHFAAKGGGQDIGFACWDERAVTVGG